MLTIILFSLLVSGVFGQVSDDCDTHHMSYMNHGVIVSENFPFDYKDDRDCRHNIYLDYTQGQNLNRTICFTFHRFALEEVKGCWNDYLMFPGSVKYCGPGYKSNHVLSLNEHVSVWEEQFCWPAPGNRFMIQFKSNALEVSRGYFMTFEIFTNKGPNDDTTTGHTLQPTTTTTTAPTSASTKQEHQINVNETIKPTNTVSSTPIMATTTTSTKQADWWCTESECSYHCHKGTKNCINCECSRAPCKSSEYTCFNRICVASDLVCNGRDNCGDLSDEQYYDARCRDTIGIEACHFDLSGSYKSWCHFEGYGWERASYSPYGPKFDHTTGLLTTDHFVYTEFTSELKVAHLTYQELPMYLDTAEPHCLSFWYFMYGRMGFLNVTMALNADTNPGQAIWFRIGDHGNQWRQGEVYIPPGTASIHKVVFTAVKAETDWHQNFALDDISMRTGECIGGDISCTFELSMCGWSTESEGDPTWVRRKGPSPTANTGPSADYDGDGFYAFMDAHQHQPETRVKMVSRQITYSFSGFKCFSFAYFMYGETVNFLYVRYKHYDSTETMVWSAHGNKGQRWHVQRIQLQQLTGPFQMVIETVRGDDDYSDVAVDNIELKEGTCEVDIELPPQRTTVPLVTTCPPNSFRCQDMTCIDVGYRCDGRFDCSDHSDEVDCPVYGGSGISTGAVVGVAVGLCAIILIIMINVVVCSRRRRNNLLQRQRNNRRPYIAPDVGPDPDSSYADFAGGFYDQPPPYAAYTNATFTGSPPPQYTGNPPEYSTYERSPPVSSNMSTVTISFQCPGDPPPSYDIAIVASPSRGSSIGALNQSMQRDPPDDPGTTNDDLSRRSSVNEGQHPPPSANVDHSSRTSRGLPRRYRRHGAGSTMRMASQPNLSDPHSDNTATASRAVSHPNLTGAADLLPTSLQPENPLLACQASSRMYSQPNMTRIPRESQPARAMASQPNLNTAYYQRNSRPMSSHPNLSVHVDNRNASRVGEDDPSYQGDKNHGAQRDTSLDDSQQDGYHADRRVQRGVPPWKRSNNPVSSRSLSMPQLAEESPSSDNDVTPSSVTMRTYTSMRNLAPSSGMEVSGETSI